MLRRAILATAICSLLVAAPAAAQTFDFRLGAGQLSGDTTYNINLDGHGRLSELMWPLDVLMITAGASADFETFTVSAEIGKNLTEDSGQMEDSDWGIYYLESGGHPRYSRSSLDIFSTSDATLDAMTFKAEALYWPLRTPTLSLGAGAGLRYQKFDFEAKDLAQFSPSWGRYGLAYDPFRAMVSGVVITYEVTYTVPYLAVAGAYRLGDMFTFEALLGYSPIAKATDRDDHVLRDKLSTGDAEGDALFVSFAARFQPWERFFFFATLDLAKIETSGTQTQAYYDNGDHQAPPELIGREFGIAQEITTTQTAAFLGAGVSF